MLAWIHEQIAHSSAEQANCDFAGGAAFHRGVVARLREVLPKVEALCARLAELEAVARWIPVTERMPQEGSTVLVWGTACDAALVGWHTRGKWSAHGGKCGLVTHWRPLPDGPEVGL